MTIADEMVEAAISAYVDRKGQPGTIGRPDVWMRAALEAALAAAPACPHIVSTVEGTHHCALAAAPQPEQEPVAWLYEAGTDRTLHWYKPPLHGTPLYTAPPQRPAEPVQEPFALPCPTPKACKAHCCSGNCIPRSKA